METTQIPGIQLPVAKIPASEVIKGTGMLEAEAAVLLTKPSTTMYPTVEEMTFRAIINSEAEGYALLRAVQILVNEFGANTILKVVGVLEKKPSLLQKAKDYLSYINML